MATEPIRKRLTRLKARRIKVADSAARTAFIAEAEASAAEVDAGGPLYPGNAVRAHVVARIAGRRRPPPPRPVRRARTR
jgi:hypothetical protein